MDITQTPDYIKMSYKNYIKRLLKSHGWNTTSKSESVLTEDSKIPSKSNSKTTEDSEILLDSSNTWTEVLPEMGLQRDHESTESKEIIQKSIIPSDTSMLPSRKISPLPSDCIDQLFKDEGPTEGSNGHLVLEKSSGFSYCTLLGQLMYSYVTCHPDIGYAVTILSKFFSTSSAFHYKLLKGVAKYLWSTIDWVIHFWHPKPLNHPDFSPLVWYNMNNDLSSSFNIDLNQPTLLGFVDAAHANDIWKQQSTTGLVHTFCGGAIVYKSKTQSLTTGSSMEAEFIAAYTTAKIARYLHMVLK